jgi:site-specific DNA recombinase
MRIAVYLRVSTQRQAQAQTIEQQLERLRAHIQSQGWELPEDCIFRDDGYSGATLNRPGLDRLRDQVKAGEIDRVLLTAPDRLARKYAHQVVVLEELEQLGCQVEFLDRPMSQDPHDQLLLQIRGAVAEYERTLIAERMRRGRQMKLRAGKLLPWTHVPYGYRVDPDHPRDPAGVRLEPAEAAVVAELFARYLEEGTTLFGLAQHLRAMGLPSPTGKPLWKPATLRGILTNPAYTGQVYAGRTRARPARQRRSALRPVGRKPSSYRKAAPQEWIPVASIPAVVSQAQFDLAQAKLAQNQQAARRNNRAHDYLLRALVSCGLCHSACFCRTCSPGYGYYVCRRKTQVFERQEGCSARYAPAGELDALVWQDLCDVITHPEMIAQALQRAQSGQWLPQELHARRENLRRGRVSLEHQVDRLSEAYLQGVIPLAEYQRRRRELEQKLDALEKQGQLLAAQVDRQAELAGLVTSIEAFCQRVGAGLSNTTFAQKRQLVELLIDRVIVSHEAVEIRYVIPTSPSGEHTRFCHLRKDYFISLAVNIAAVAMPLSSVTAVVV